MLQDLSYKYYHKYNTKTVYVVLHGGGPEGIETPFISNIISALTNTGTSVFGFNFPYCARGEEKSSGPELAEETATLEKVVQFLRDEGFEKIVIVAKSLGGIVASFWLAKQPNETVDVMILGYCIGDVKTEALQGKLKLVIQGEYDRYGNANALEDELSQHNITAKVIELAQADHSYRNENKEPVYQDKAIEALIQALSAL